ncbi:hypothetical protein BDF19DRAFT_497685 [Syncephalis fuscata]|nr:hypothetical protein BDF19DRAFT_497685 [Syncephalis fuscata]
MDDRRQLRLLQPARSNRPYTTVETANAPNSGTGDYLHVAGGISSNASTLRPYSVTTYAETDGVPRLADDTYFAPLDPMRPPDHWEFSTSTGGSINLGRQFSSGSVQSALARDAAYVAGLPDSGSSVGLTALRTSPAMLPADLTTDSRSCLDRSATGSELDDLSGTTPVNVGMHLSSINPPSVITPDMAVLHGHGTTSTRRTDALTVHTGRTGLSSQSGHTEGTSYYGAHAVSAMGGPLNGNEPSSMADSSAMDERYRFQIDPLPQVFDGRVTPEELRETIETLNRILAQGDEGTGRSFLRHSLSCAVFYLGFCCTQSDYQETLDKAQAFLVEENRRLYISRGLRWRDPRQTAFLHLELLLV